MSGFIIERIEDVLYKSYTVNVRYSSLIKKS